MPPRPVRSAATTAPPADRVPRWIARPAAEVKTTFEGPLVRNAASLYGSTIVTSVLGFVYWLVAARMASTRAVGVASAIQSAAQLLAIFCVLGLSTLLISELSAERANGRSLMLTAAAGVSMVTVVISAMVGAGLQRLSPLIREHGIAALDVPLFIVLSTLTTVLLLLDDACVGLLRGDLQLRRNTVFALTKLAILPILVALWASRLGSELVLAWTVGLAVSLVTVSIQLRRLTDGQPSRLEFKRLLAKRRLIAAHHWLNVSVQAPRLALPILVATIVSAQRNASYTAAMLVIGFVNIIPAHLSTVMFALSPDDERALRREVRKSMRICLPLAGLSAAGFLLLSRYILDIFGPGYQRATHALVLLGFTTLPVAIKSQYIAISRVRGRMGRAGVRMLLGACCEVGFAALGGTRWGVNGVAAGYLSAYVIEAALFGPTVLGVVRAKVAGPTQPQHLR